jgi:hypothetical protein
VTGNNPALSLIHIIARLSMDVPDDAASQVWLDAYQTVKVNPNPTALRTMGIVNAFRAFRANVEQVLGTPQEEQAL